MTRFDHVKEILDRAVNWEAIGAHGPFWRNRTRNQFVQARVFGMPLLVLGQPADSNLIRAIRGIAPFGEDVGTLGAFYRRMPAGGPAVPDEDITFLEQWIAEGCLEDEWPPAPTGALPQGTTDQQINDYFRALDNWALFEATDEVREAVGTFFGAVETWFALARGVTAEGDWANVLALPETQGAIAVLGAGQETTVRQFFGNPPRNADLALAYERFGEASLSRDPQRPQRDHRMDGEVMWFIWLGFAEAARNLGREAAFWEAFSRAILLGMMSDGVFRGRFTVQGFSADAAGREAMRSRVRGLSPEGLTTEGRTRFAESGIGS
jgi:hypothetical protein